MALQFNTSETVQRRNSLVIWLIGGLLLVGIIVGSFFLFFSNPTLTTSETDTGNISPVQLADLWEAGDYEALTKAGEETLQKQPLNFEALLLTGFASYYHGSALLDIEAQKAALYRSVSLLRQCLVMEPYRNNGDIFYVLGKAYYGLGYFYHDLSLRYFIKAENLGYRQPDSDEFLGVVHASMGEPQKALDYFERSLQKNYDDSVQLALVSTHLSMDAIEEATEELADLLGKVKDPLVLQKARFIKADILMKGESYDEAMVYYQEILADDPKSADAHYYIGEIYFAKGDTIKARAEWRSAVLQDPGHSAAINRLSTSL